jgi:hypothetical protein
MIHPTRKLVMAALSLLSVLSAHAANIKISYLPFNITAPGTYVLTGNLSFTVTEVGGINTGAINISTAIAGPVVVDLKGYTITGPGSLSLGVTIGAISWNVSSAYPITIQNGTISNVELGVIAPSSATLSNIAVKNIIFNITSTANAVGYGVNWGVSNSTVSNCTFNGATYGLADYNSTGVMSITTSPL